MPARQSTSEPILDRRTLNRTLLARQHLLERVDRPVAEVVEHLVGMQAQEPPDPYVGLWSRIARSDPAELSTLIETRGAVRMGLMRTTLHLVTAPDARRLHPVMRGVLARAWRSSPFAKQLAGLDLGPVLERARALLEAQPRSPSELGAALAEEFPGRDPASLAYAARFLLPLVQVPPRGLWGRTSRATNTTAEAWLGGPLGDSADPEEAILRYLAAFGPATVGDMRVWSWLTGLRAVVERLRPRLRTYRDERGRELLDIGDGLIADPATPAPIRLLPQYDNVFLSHEDRSRILVEPMSITDLAWKGSILVDGFVSGTWRHRVDRGAAAMSIETVVPITGHQREELEAEATALLAFLTPTAASRAVDIVAAQAHPRAPSPA